MAQRVPSEKKVLGYFQTASNWGRWGKKDQLGTLNLVTPSKTARAVRLVKEGVTVSCARVISQEMAPDVSHQFQHFMYWTGEGLEEAVMKGGTGGGASMDYISMVFHGITITHLDSLCHAFWKAKMYNGFPSNLVTSREGAQAESVEQVSRGVVTRGVLLDIPRLRGKLWLEPGEGVYPKDLEAAEKAQGVRVEEGDVLLLRVGHVRRRKEVGPIDAFKDGMAGPHAAIIPWLRERGVAMLGCDSANDVIPTGYSAELGIPMHSVGIVALGLWLLDNGDFEELTQACAQRNRWEFLFFLSPLRIHAGTGSPVNPIAVF